MRAFTLVELVAVITLLALLLAGGVMVGAQAREGGKRQQTRMTLAAVAAEVESAKVQEGSYPANLDALKGEFADAWGNPLAYARDSDENSFTLTSAGANASDAGDDVIYDSTNE